MFGSTVLEVALGLVFLYLVLSLICTSINESIAQLVGLRAENLYEAIHGLFTGVDQHRFAQDIFEHPSVQSLSRKQFSIDLAGDKGQRMANMPKKPSDLPASTFSHVVMDLLGVKEPEGSHTDSSTSIKDALSKPPYDEGVMKVLTPLIDASNGSLDGARKNIESWYDNHMDKATTWYKRKAQVMTFIVGLLLVFVINADSVMFVDKLWTNPTQLAQIAANAKNATPTEDSQASENSVLSLLGWASVPGSQQDALGALGKMFGSSEGEDANVAPSPYDRQNLPQNRQELWAKLIGLLLTVFAISLGAPFWFDKLKLIMNIRGGGPTTQSAEQQRIPSSDSPHAPKTPTAGGS